MKTKNLKQFLLTGGILMATISFCPAGLVNAAEVSEAPEIIRASKNGEEGIDPQADIIYYRYRVNNGIRQKRRWNETKGCWVDPYWINID